LGQPIPSKTTEQVNTFLIQSEQLHRDLLDNESVIKAGDVK